MSKTDRRAFIMRKWAFLLILATSLARADVVILRDGTRLEGDLNRVGDGWTITLADGKTRSFALDAVRSVQLGSTTSHSALVDSQGLASLRRSVEALGDINQIIDRYQRFIDNTKDPATLTEARSDMSMWRQRQQQKLVKFGGKWVTPGDVAQITAKATEQASDARELIRQNRMREADAMLQQILAADPQNAAGLYLRGVVLYRQDKLPDARRAFEAVNAAVPSHPPTLNNIAIICGRQNQQPASLLFYDQAMQAAGVNEYILNNVAEALAMIPEEQRKSGPAAKAMRRFAELDQMLQQRKTQQGLFRWGSTWVDEKKLDELKASEKEVRTKLDAMQIEFAQTEARINTIDANIASNETSMNQLRFGQVFHDSKGNAIYLPPPQAYYDLQKQNQDLRAEQDSLRAKLSSLQEQAKRVQQMLPVPQFTGIQQIVGVEGMPEAADLAAPHEVAPTTAPDSTP
ncbi:MAG TPA: tetratricopeptide repeat protein [Tepidisphaeraceae bacterium]|nr:tetratricopeptide repeat protein [Tepidisphaeraceae bacterium]